MRMPVYIFLITFSFLSACQQEDPVATVQEAAPNTSQQQTTVQDKIPAEPSRNNIEREPGDPLPTISSASEPEGSPYRETSWDDLMSPEYRPEVVLEKFMEQLNQLEDDDPKAMELYGQIQAELENAPINPALNGKRIKLAGFIAPLENTGGKVSEFLLVPYFGACIHVPPPPINQTVLVKTVAESAVEAEKLYDPIWVKGKITTEGEKTDIGQAGYRIVNALIEPYDE